MSETQNQTENQTAAEEAYGNAMARWATQTLGDARAAVLANLLLRLDNIDAVVGKEQHPKYAMLTAMEIDVVREVIFVACEQGEEAATMVDSVAGQCRELGERVEVLEKDLNVYRALLHEFATLKPKRGELREIIRSVQQRSRDALRIDDRWTAGPVSDGGMDPRNPPE